VEYENTGAAAAAIDALDKTEVGGRQITVSFARKSGDPVPPKPTKLLVSLSLFLLSVCLSQQSLSASRHR
jgi:hypothetical protein